MISADEVQKLGETDKETRKRTKNVDSEARRAGSLYSISASGSAGGVAGGSASGSSGLGPGAPGGSARGQACLVRHEKV